MSRKAQASVITIVLLILIAVVSILVLWNVLNLLINKDSSKIDLDKFMVNLKIEDAVLFLNGASEIIVSRGKGSAEITSLKFVFYDETGNSHVETKEENLLKEFETRSYNFSPPPIGKIQKISVFPMIGDELGSGSEFKTLDLLNIPLSLISWWDFEDSSDFQGTNNCGFIIKEDLEKGRVGEFNDIFVECQSNESFDIKNMGASFWIKTEDLQGIIIQKENNYLVSLNEGKIVFNYLGQTRTSNAAINDGNWHHIGISMLSTYVDGNPDVSLEINEGLIDDSKPLLIGNFNGFLDDLMLFKDSLSNTQIKAIYQNQV